jgi:hypothetical protein
MRGTGRHARHLLDLGHEVLEIDLTPEMLTRAAANVPEARFLESDLTDIPAPDEVISVLHPFLTHLGWQAPFADARGQRGFIREHTHTPEAALEAYVGLPGVLVWDVEKGPT